MFFESAYDVLKSVKNRDVVIVGAGKTGTELAEFFIYNNISVVYFLDNNPLLKGKTILGLSVYSQKYIENCGYVIAVDKKYRSELITQLKSKGISEDNIIIYYPTPHDKSYITNHGEKELENAISAMFRNTFGYDINWENPITYNEKINWEKARVKDDKRTLCADKFRVREFVRNQIGDGFLTRIYGDWNKPEDIDFESLPSKFVIKMNNGSARNIIVRNKDKIDKNIICKLLNEWMLTEWAYTSFELHYKDIVPHIYCEELLEGVETDEFSDYKVFCFRGKVKFIQRIRFEHTDKALALFYDKEWIKQPFNQYYDDDVEVEKPTFLNDIILYSEKLASGFKHVRVDWFITPDDKIYFGEMTFANWSGLEKFIPNEIDEQWGNLI